MTYRNNIGLDIWFKKDILQTLRAVDSANLDIASEIDSPEMRLYRRGFEAAIRAVAEAFGLDYHPPQKMGSAPRTIDVIPRRRW